MKTFSWMEESDRTWIRLRIEQAIAQDQYRFSLLDSLVTEEVALLE